MYSELDHAKAKLVASHAMMPVGPSADVGGQHGFLRWADYDLAGRVDDLPGLSMATLNAKTADAAMHVLRAFSLEPTKAAIDTSVWNHSPAPYATSLGEHLYFALPDGAAPEDMRINGQTIDSLLHAGATKQIKQGHAQHWAAYPGEVSVAMPDDSLLHIESHFDGNARLRGHGLGMSFWQRPGQPYICLEPTFGFGVVGEQVSSNGLEIPAYTGAASLQTVISAH